MNLILYVLHVKTYMGGLLVTLLLTILLLVYLFPFCHSNASRGDKELEQKLYSRA